MVSGVCGGCASFNGMERKVGRYAVLVERESIDRGNREASKLNLGQMSVVKVRASIAFAGLESILQIPWF
jgi:hypothetical protein